MRVIMNPTFSSAKLREVHFFNLDLIAIISFML